MAAPAFGLRASPCSSALATVSERRPRFSVRGCSSFVSAASGGGKGVVLGWTVDQTAWEAAIRAALQTPHVAQERISLPSELWPAFVDGRLHVGERMLDTAPYVCQGEYVDGCLTRIARP